MINEDDFLKVPFHFLEMKTKFRSIKNNDVVHLSLSSGLSQMVSWLVRTFLFALICLGEFWLKIYLQNKTITKIYRFVTNFFITLRQNPMKGGVGFYWKKRNISPPPLWPPPLFLGKKFFFGFSEKFSKFFFNEIDCKKFSNFFYNEVSSKKFFNSLKMTTKNFRNFFQ